MSDKKSDPPPKSGGAEPGTSVVLPDALAVSVLPPENGKAGTPVNVNVVVTQLAQRERPELLPDRLRETLAIIREHESEEIGLFSRRAAAIIEAKTKDPDYISRRADAAGRRVLRYSVMYVPPAALILIACLAMYGKESVFTGALVMGLLALATFSVTLVALLGSRAEGPTAQEINALATTILGGKAREDVDEPAPRPQPQPRRRNGRKS
jgi:hypothetical protein